VLAYNVNVVFYHKSLEDERSIEAGCLCVNKKYDTFLLILKHQREIMKMIFSEQQHRDLVDAGKAGSSATERVRGNKKGM
jgi:hypothetical protein